MPFDLLPEVRLLTDSLRPDAPRLDCGRVQEWGRLLDHADAHSLTPLLYATWLRRGTLDDLPPDAQARLQRAYLDNGRRNMYIRAELIDLHYLLEAAGVPHLVLKGWPLVERLYADPAERVLYDHDLLVSGAHALAGHAALRAAGFGDLPARDAWVEKHLPPLWRNDGYRWDGYLFDPLYPRPVELHVQLWETGWRGLAVRPLPDPWPRAQSRLVAGVPMLVLSEADTLVHLAMHFAGHLVEREARLNQLLDLARFRSAAEVDWGLVTELAAASGISRFVYAALSLAHAIFGAPLPPEPAWGRLAAQTPARFRAWLESEGPADVLTGTYRRRHRGPDYQLTFLAARSWIERLGILRFAALPPLGQLQATYHVRHRWQAALLLPLHLTHRLLAYARDYRPDNSSTSSATYSRPSSPNP